MEKGDKWVFFCYKEINNLLLCKIQFRYTNFNLLHPLKEITGIIYKATQL